MMAEKDANEVVHAMVVGSTTGPIHAFGPDTTLAQLAAQAFIKFFNGDREPIELVISGGVVSLDKENKPIIDKKLILHFEITVREPS